jgi:hypothetical protein
MVAVLAIIILVAESFVGVLCSGGGGSGFQYQASKEAVHDKTATLETPQTDAEGSDKATDDGKAYDAEVARLKTEHQKSPEKSRADEDAFEKASRIYRQAKEAFDAAKELKEAGTLYNHGLEIAKHDPTEGAMRVESAYRRCRDIVDRYPGSQVAEDAKALLETGRVVNRPIPAEPVPPVSPTEQRQAEAARKAAEEAAEAEARRKAEAEAARKAKEDYAETLRRGKEYFFGSPRAQEKAESEEYNADGLVLLWKTVKGAKDEFSIKITGK